ncbi:Origin recognition complex, subunit 1 [Agyrium rufum]|nr:Origin recognition complex, subunit 1 [Agyrium rufum]
MQSSKAPKAVGQSQEVGNSQKSTGIARDDSDDELGNVDHPWEWIYDNEEADELVIIGAYMGDFRCYIGDAVLLKAESPIKEAWVGLISSFIEVEEDGEKQARFMWFSSEQEIRNQAKKRKDAYPNELYITATWDINPLASINGKARITSPDSFFTQFPSGKIPQRSKNLGKIFICRRGCNTRNATYTEEFDWNEAYKDAADLQSLADRITEETKIVRKRKREDQELEVQVEIRSGVISKPRTPQKKVKHQGTDAFPQAEAALTAKVSITTPRHKRIVVKKPLEFTPLGTRILSPTHVASSPFQIARTRLHVSAIPSALPCREEVFANVYAHLEAAITEGSGTCIYISGTPGTGKTATVREVVARLNAAVQEEELDDFIFVEINGMKVTDPHQSYSLLWEALRGDRVSPAHALDLLEREFTHPNPRRVPCVVLMDELDQLVTKTQSVMYNFFNWPGLQHSRLIVLAVANTMDLPERTLSNKISSRMGLTRITFPGYNHQQLMRIIESRLQTVPGNIVDPDAIQFASRKVAAVSGDARRALDICRRAVEIAEADNNRIMEGLVTTPSKHGRGKIMDEISDTLVRNGRVTIATIRRAINEATSTPMQLCLKTLPQAAKIVVAALLARLRRSGTGECLLGDVVEESQRMAKMMDERVANDLLSSRSDRESDYPIKKHMAGRMYAIGAATVELTELGIIAVESRRAERMSKVRLTIGEDEVRLALNGDSEVEGLGF